MTAQKWHNHPNPPRIRTVCIIGHNPLSTSLLTHLSKNPLNLHLHHLHSSSAQKTTQDLPPVVALPTFRMTDHKHPNTTFSDPKLLSSVLSSLSPPADLVISTGHGGDYALQTLLISACIAARVPRFMPAEFGLDTTSEAVRGVLPPYRERSRVLDFLRDKASIEWVGVATGVDLGRRLVDGNMGVDLEWQSASVFGSGEERMFVSTEGFVADVVRGVIEGWEGFRNRYLCVAEVETCYRGVLSALEKEMGCSFQVGYLEREEGLVEANKRIERGFPDAGMFLLQRSVLVDGESFGGFRRDLPLREKWGLKEGSLDAIIRGVVHDFRHHGKGGCGCS